MSRGARGTSHALEPQVQGFNEMFTFEKLHAQKRSTFAKFIWGKGPDRP